MATQLIREDAKSKSNWKRMLDAADKLEFQDGRLVAGKGWRIDDMDADSISTKLTTLGIEHIIRDRYCVIIK